MITGFNHRAEATVLMRSLRVDAVLGLLYKALRCCELQHKKKGWRQNRHP